MALVELQIPVGWFDNKWSEKICTMLDIRIIKAKEWTKLEKLFFFPLPPKFNLVEYIISNRLHAIIFESNDQTIILHPDLIRRIAGRELKRIQRKDGVH